jgi:hypothetical protein
VLRVLIYIAKFKLGHNGRLESRLIFVFKVGLLDGFQVFYLLAVLEEGVFNCRYIFQIRVFLNQGFGETFVFEQLPVVVSFTGRFEK